MNKGVSDKLLSSFNSFSIEVTGKPLSVSNPTLTPLSLKDLSKDWLIGFTLFFFDVIYNKLLEKKFSGGLFLY